MGASPSSALAVSSMVRERQQGAASASSLAASSSSAAAASSLPAYSLLTPTRPAVESLESIIVVDLREAAHKGTAHAGSATMRLQLFPAVTEPGPDPSSSRVPDPPHPRVHPVSDAARYHSEVEFVRSMISELLVGTGEWELQSLHRLFNANWVSRFQAQQKALAPALFKSAPPTRDGCGSLFIPHLRSAVLMHLLKFGNDSPVGVPVFAWHGTKNEATLPSMLHLGLSTKFSVRGGRNIFVSQNFAHSVSYCLSEPKHLFLCLVLRTQDEITAYGTDNNTAIHAMAIPEQERVMPIYQIAVKFKAAGTCFVNCK